MTVTIKYANNGLAVLYNVTHVTENDQDIRVYQDGYIINKYGEEEYDESCRIYSKAGIVSLEIKENEKAIKIIF